jgi:hypothetical protein
MAAQELLLDEERERLLQPLCGESCAEDERSEPSVEHAPPEPTAA